MAHSEFSPSQLNRIIQCPSSVQLYRELVQYKDGPSSSYAEEGTLLHSYMERAIHEDDLSFIPDDEHRATVKTARDYVWSQVPIPPDDHLLLQEHRVEVPGVPQVFGTADLIVHIPGENELHLFDYKFGAGIFVNPENNPQFMAYMLGAINATGMDTTGHLFIHVVQPRMDNMQYITVSYDHLIQWRDEVLIPAIAKANSDKSYFGPSESACRFCAVKARCPACFQAAQDAAAAIFKLHGLCKDSATVPMEDVTKFFKDVERVQQMAKAIKEYFLSELASGRKVPGYKIGYSRGTRKWKDEGAAVEYLTAEYGLGVNMFNTELKSPAQMEKLVKGLKKDKTFESLVHTPQGAPKLIPIDEDSNENPFKEIMD